MCSYVIAIVYLLVATLLTPTHCQDSFVSNCTGSGAKVRQLMLYGLQKMDADTINAVNQLFQQRLAECQSVLYPGSSYGSAAISTSPTVYGFPPSRPMPPNSAVVDWVGWMDFFSLDGARECLEINKHTGTLQAMQAYAQPNSRFDLIANKTTAPGVRQDPCPLPDSYAPATVRYIFAYLLPQGADKAQVCKKGSSLWQRMLKTAAMDVRHGTSCSLLTDEDARLYDMEFNSGFGGYVDFATMRDMTRYLASNNRSIQAHRKQLRSLASYAVRAAIVLPWSGRR